jgi:nucleotide-binding universal stress UspA family protein
MTTYNYCVSPTTGEEEAGDMSRVFLRILSPVDFHENSLAALEYAAQFARQYDATVYLLHVIPTDELHLHREVYRPTEGGGADIRWAEKVSKENLQAIAQKHLSGGIRHEILTRVGDAAKSILETAEEVGAELIVMATHGRTGIAHFFLGSVAEQVVREAPCPVLTIRQK